MKVLICDYIGNSAQWIEQFSIKKNIEVVGTISPVNKGQRHLLLENSWEYLLIFEQGMRGDFEKLAQFLKISTERIIYALDWDSWAEHPAATFTLINPVYSEVGYRMSAFNIARQLNYFMTTTTAEGINYIATSKDNFIIKTMYTRRKNWAETEIKLFHDWAKKFYNVDESNGYFLDLGANIGTTGIYFQKILAPDLKLLAFEPDPENFKLLRANLILNDVENVVAENYGLGIKETEMTMYRVTNNPGANRLFEDSWGKEKETVKIITLDKYFEKNNISPKSVKYIWIDTEGFEAQVLLGAKNLLSENPAPIFMEFNPQFWQKSGYYEKLMELLTTIYTGFAFAKEVNDNETIKVYSIEKLWEFQNYKHITGELGDIFLIHKL